MELRESEKGSTMTTGERIRQKRMELGLTQDELAKKAGYKSRSSINKIECSRDLPLNKVKEIAAVLGCSPAWLLGWGRSERIRRVKMGKCDKCRYYSEDSDCVECNPNYKTTNADKIRSMSDEELAEFLVNFKNTFGKEYEGKMSCLEWLQSEAE